MSADLLERLSQQDVRIWFEDGELRYSAPRRWMTEDRRRWLREHKPVILQALQSQPANDYQPDAATTSDSGIKPDPDSLEGKKPYRITLDDGPQLIWLERGLTPEQVLDQAAQRYGAERVSLEPPSAGWPRLVDIPELPASNPPPPESPCPACASTYWWQARGGGPWHCRHCDGVDFDNQQDCTLTMPPARPKTDATQPPPPDPDPDRALVCCDDCQHFGPDQIGDGTGIGRCTVGVVPRPQVDPPLYPRAPRRCGSFDRRLVWEAPLTEAAVKEDIVTPPVPAEPAIQGEYLGKEPDDFETSMNLVKEQADRVIEQIQRLAAEEEAAAKLVAAQPGITLDNVATVIGWSHQQAAAALERAKLAGRVTARGEQWYLIPISR